MIKITVIAVGKLKEKYLEDAYSEYSKRLKGYCNLQIIELSPARADEGSAASISAAIEDEGARILAKIPQKSLVIPMCIEGKELSSEELAAVIKNAPLDAFSEITFIIGGSYGLSDKVKAQGKIRLSMSKMTFPHQIARIMLLEQIYRGFKINEGGSYHK